MKKKLITLAVASTLAATVVISAPAFADTSNVTVYGVANMSFDRTDTGVVSATQVSSNQSRLGLKGSEDLGDGLSAVWQIEQQINIDNSTTNPNTFASRNSFLGLSSASAGTALLGRHDTPYKIATRGLDIFGDTIADNRTLMGSTAGGGNFRGLHDARLGDVVAYISPAMSGFTGAIAYSAGAETASTAAQIKGGAWSLAGLYGDGPLNASLAYQVIDVGTTGTGGMAAGTLPAGVVAGDKVKAWKLGGGYTMDAITVNAVYEKTSNTLAGASAGGQTNFYLGGKYSFGSDAIKLAYTRAGDVQATTNTGAKQWAVGYDHSLSKRTTLYALYTSVNNDTTAAYGLTTVSTGGAAGVASQDPSAISFGMKHTF